MRTRAIAGLLLALLAVVGCDSDDPLQVEQRTAEVSFLSTGATVKLYDAFELVEDTDLDGNPDDFTGDGQPDTDLYCAFNGASTALTNMVWDYALTIDILRSGEVVSERLTSDAAAGAVGNRTPYDTKTAVSNAFLPSVTVTHDIGLCSGNPSVVCNPAGNPDFCSDINAGVLCLPQGTGQITRSFFFRAPRKLSAGHPEVVNTVRNIVNDVDPDRFNDEDSNADGIPDSGREDGLCPGFPIADPSIDGEPPPFLVDLEDGDTVIVEARRAEFPPFGLLYSQEEITENPALRAIFTLDGQQVPVEGNITGGSSNTASISFYTLR